MMKRFLSLLVCLLTIMDATACSNEQGLPEEPQVTGQFLEGKRILIAYFSWGGTTRRMAQEIQRVTGGDLFEMEPVNSYPTEYTPCTEVALAERDNNARPAIKATVADWEAYDVVLQGLGTTGSVSEVQAWIDRINKTRRK